MNCESCEEPKNSRTAAAAGLALMRSCGITESISTEDMRSLIARSMRSRPRRSEEHTSELQSLMRISYAVFCLKKKKEKNKSHQNRHYKQKIQSIRRQKKESE